MENSFKNKIHQIIRITSKNGKPEYRGSTYPKNDVVLEPGYISDSFELREPEFYKIATTVTRDDYIQNIYTLPVVRRNEQTLVDESKYGEIHQNAWIFPGEYISKKKPIKISEKKTMRLYIVPGSHTLFYQQGNQNSCIISSLASALHYMGDEYLSEYIIKRKQKYLLEIQNKCWMHFCRDILIGHHIEKRKRLNYRIE